MAQFSNQDNSSQQDPDHNERIFTQQDLWYFTTEEGENVGPFRYRSEAQSNLEQFLANLKNRLK